jgi:hypothetical protein
MVQITEAGSSMLRGSGSAFHGSAPPACDGRTITRLCYLDKAQITSVQNVQAFQPLRSVQIAERFQTFQLFQSFQWFRGGVVVGNMVEITIDAEAILQEG